MSTLYIKDANGNYIPVPTIRGAKGDPGVYVGTEEPNDPNVNVWVEPDATPEPVVKYERQTLSEAEKAQARENIGAVNKKEFDILSENIMNNGGLTAKQISSLNNMFKIAAYTSDASNAYAAFKAAFGILIPDPVVDLALNDVTSNIITNKGTGGNAYNANIIERSDTYESNENGLYLKKDTYASLNYPFVKSKSFSVCIKGAFVEMNDNGFQQLWRTETEFPSAYSMTQASLEVKLSAYGTSSAPITNISGIGSVGAVYSIPLIGNHLTAKHTHVWVGDASEDVMYYYLDGVLTASQRLSAKGDTSTINLGDTSSPAQYYANKILISDCRVWDCALNAEQVTFL